MSNINETKDEKSIKETNNCRMHTFWDEPTVSKVVHSNCVGQERNGNNSASLTDYEIGEWNQENENISEEMDTRSPENVPIRKLFIGNIPKRASARNLRTLFSAFGKIIDVYISRNVFTEVRQHYGFVTFLSPEDATRALEAGFYVLFNRDLTVEPADLHHQPFKTSDGHIQWRNRKWTLSGNPVLVTVDLPVSACSKESPVKDDCVDEEIDESLCFINNLNDDCLSQVLKYLSKLERIKIERVCKHWQHVSKMLWSDTKVLKIADIKFKNFTFPDMVNIPCLLSRCGKYLTSLDMSAITHRLFASVITIIARRCSQLQHLNISGIPVNKPALQQLGKHRGSKLLSLHMECCNGIHDCDLADLFRFCTNLEVVNVSRTKQITGKCFFFLPANSLTALVVNDCNNIRPALLIKSLKRFHKLKTLMMNCCISLTNLDITQIVETLPQLTEFSMSRFFPFIQKSAVQTLHLLTNLVSLDVQLNPLFDDAIMENIGKACTSIRYLNISGCGLSSTLNDSRTLTDTGICCVLKIPELEMLKMSYLGHVTDKTLEVAANHSKLKHLECRGCPEFTDLGCSRVVSECTQLEQFDFSGCRLVTNATVMAAVDSVKQRTTKTTLSLVVGGTSITEDKNHENVPLLNISYIDLCVPHLRPDFAYDQFLHDEEFMPFDFDGMDDVAEWGWCEQDFDVELGLSDDSDDDYEDYDIYELLNEYSVELLGPLY